MATIAEIVARLALDASDYLTNAEKVGGSTNSIYDAFTKLQGSIDSLSSQFDKYTQSLNNNSEAQAKSASATKASTDANDANAVSLRTSTTALDEFGRSITTNIKYLEDEQAAVSVTIKGVNSLGLAASVTASQTGELDDALGVTATTATAAAADFVIAGKAIVESNSSIIASLRDVGAAQDANIAIGDQLLAVNQQIIEQNAVLAVEANNMAIGGNVFTSWQDSYESELHKVSAANMQLLSDLQAGKISFEEFSQGAEKSANSLDILRGSANSAGNAHLSLVGPLGIAAAAFVMVGKAATDEAAQLEGAQERIVNSGNQTVASIQNLNSSFNTGTNSAVELDQAYAKVAGELTAMNGSALTAAQTQDVMRQAQDLSLNTGEGLNETTKSLVDTMRDYGIGINNSDQAANGLLGTSRLLSESLSQSAEQYGQVNQALGSLNPTFNDTKQIVDSLGQNGPIFNRTLNSFSQGFTALLSGTTNEYNALKQYGIYITDANGATLPFNTIQSELAQNIGSMGEAAGTAALKTLGFGTSSSDAYKYFHQLNEEQSTGIDNMKNYANNTGDASKQAETLDGKLKSLNSDFHDLLATIGESPFSNLIDGLDKVVKGFEALETGDFVHKMIGLAAVGLSFSGNPGAAIGILQSMGSGASKTPTNSGRVSGPSAGASGMSYGTPSGGAIVQGGYTVDQLVKFAQNAGFSGNDLATIVAIALRESSGVPGQQDYAGSGHYGLLQFSSDLRNTYGVNTMNDKDPAVAQAEFNAAAKIVQARRNSGQQGFNDWGGWTEGGTALPVPTGPDSVIGMGGESMAEAYPNIFGQGHDTSSSSVNDPALNAHLSGPPVANGGFGDDGDPAAQAQKLNDANDTAQNDLDNLQKSYPKLYQSIVDGSGIVTQQTIDDDQKQVDSKQNSADAQWQIVQGLQQKEQDAIKNGDLAGAAQAHRDVTTQQKKLDDMTSDLTAAREKQKKDNTSFTNLGKDKDTIDFDLGKLGDSYTKMFAKTDEGSQVVTQDMLDNDQKQVDSKKNTADQQWQTVQSLIQDETTAQQAGDADTFKSLHDRVTKEQGVLDQETSDLQSALSKQSADKKAAAEQDKAAAAAALQQMDDQRTSRNENHTETLTINTTHGDAWKAMLTNSKDETGAIDAQIADIDKQLQGTLSSDDRQTLEDRRTTLEAYRTESINTFNDINDAARAAAAEAKAENDAKVASIKDLTDQNKQYTTYLTDENAKIPQMWKDNLTTTEGTITSAYDQIKQIDQQLQGNLSEGDRATLEQRKQDLEAYLSYANDTFSAVNDAAKAAAKVQQDVLTLNNNQQDYEIQQTKTYNDALMTVAKDRQTLQNTLANMQASNAKQDLSDQKSILDSTNALYDAEEKLAILTGNQGVVNVSGSGLSPAQQALDQYQAQSELIKEQLDSINQQKQAQSDQLNILKDQDSVYKDIMDTIKAQVAASPQSEAIQGQIDQIKLAQDQMKAGGVTPPSYLDTQLSSLEAQLSVMNDQATIQNEGLQNQENSLTVQQDILKTQQDQYTLQTQPQVNALNQQQNQLQQLTAIAQAQSNVDSAVQKLNEDEQKQADDRTKQLQDIQSAVSNEATSENDTMTKAYATLSDNETKFNNQRTAGMQQYVTDANQASALAQNAFQQMAGNVEGYFTQMGNSANAMASSMVASFTAAQAQIQMLTHTGPYAPVNFPTPQYPGAPTVLNGPQLVPGAPQVIPQVIGTLANGVIPSQAPQIIGQPVQNTTQIYMNGQLIAGAVNNFTYSGQVLRSTLPV